jgi:hypothetical protein
MEQRHGQGRRLSPLGEPRSTVDRAHGFRFTLVRPLGDDGMSAFSKEAGVHPTDPQCGVH